MRPSRTREERAQNNLYLNDQDLVREHQKQAEEKRRIKQLQELQDKEDTLHHYRNYNLGGAGNQQNDPETADMMHQLQKEEDFVNQLKAKLENQDPDFFIKYQEEQMQKQRRDKVDQYHKLHQENNDPNSFMFVQDPTSGQHLSKGELERQKRLQLREQERQRRLLGQETSAYDQQQQKRDQPLSLPFQLEQQINGANDDERRQKRINDLFDDPVGEPMQSNNNNNQDMFRQTQSNFHHLNKDNNFEQEDNFRNNNNNNYYNEDGYSSNQQQQQIPSTASNNQNQKKDADNFDTDIFGNKKPKRMIKGDQVNRPIDNVYQGEQEGGNQNYQSPQQNNLYSQNTQKLQQNFSNNRRKSFTENQDDGKLPSIQSGNRKSNDYSNKAGNAQNSGGGNSNIFGIGGNQPDSKRERMLKYRQELDQQKEINSQIGYSIKPYSAQHDKRSHGNQQHNGGSPQSRLPPPPPGHNNNNNQKDRDGFFDKFGQDPQFKKNLQNWEQQQNKNLLNAGDQFKPYSAQPASSRDIKNTPGRPPVDPQNNNNDNFFDKFGRDQPSNRNQLRRPQSYQNIDERQNMARMSTQEYADHIMKDMMGRNNTQNDRPNNNNNSYHYPTNLNKSLNNNLDDYKQNEFNANQYHSNDNKYNPNINNYVQNNDNRANPPQGGGGSGPGPAGGKGVFMTDEQEQKQRQREKERELQKILEEQIKQKQQKKEEDKRKEQEYDQRFTGNDRPANNQNQNQNGNAQRGGDFQQQQQQQQQLSYQPSTKSIDYEALMNNNDQQQYSGAPAQSDQYQYDPYNQQQPQSNVQQQQAQQKDGANFARNKVLYNETVDRDGQQKAIEAKKRFAAELNEQRKEAEKKKQEEKKRQQEEDLKAERRMMQEVEEEKRKQELEEQKKNKKNLEAKEFNKNLKDEHEKGKGGKHVIEVNNDDQKTNNTRKPNYHQTQNQSKLDDFDRRKENENVQFNKSNRLDLFEDNQSIQQQNFEYLQRQQQPYNLNNSTNLNNNNNNNMYQKNNFSDLGQGQNFQNQQQQLFQNNQFQYGGMMPNTQQYNQNMMNQMMGQGNQLEQQQYMMNPFQMMMQQHQQQNMMSMMQMDQQYFNQMLMAPNLQYYLFNKNEIEMQRQLMEEKLRIHQFALQEQNLIDEYRQRLNKAKEDKEEFEKKIDRMKNEIENKFGEHFNMQLFSQIILDEAQKNRQSSLDSYHNLKQSFTNFKKNAEQLDRQIQQRQTNSSNFFPNSSQRPPLDSRVYGQNQMANPSARNNNAIGSTESNHSLQNFIKRIEDIPMSMLHPPAQPQRNSQLNFEGTLKCDTHFQEIQGFNFDESFVREKQEKIGDNSQQSLTQNNNHGHFEDTSGTNRQFENSNFLPVPEAMKNNTHNHQIQQSFLQKTYQSQMMQSMNPNISANQNNSNANHQNLQHRSAVNQNSQALNINLNDNQGSVIEELPREEMDDTSKNHDKSDVSNNFSLQQPSSLQQQPQPNSKVQYKTKLLNFDRQNLMKNASDFHNEDDKVVEPIQKYELNESELEQNDQDEYYSSGYAHSDVKRTKGNASSVNNFPNNESQQPYQSQLIELKKTAEYYKHFQEFISYNDGKESRFSKQNNNNNNDEDDEDDQEEVLFNNNNKKDKQNNNGEDEDDDEDEDGFENNNGGYDVNKYYNKEQIIEEDIEGTATEKNLNFDDKLHFDSEQKKKFKQAISEINRNSNELGLLENNPKQNKEYSSSSPLNDPSLKQEKSNENNNKTKNAQKETSYQQIQLHLDESVNVPSKKDKGEDDGLGQTQVSEIHTTMKETDRDKKITTGVAKLLKQHTELLNNFQNVEENETNNFGEQSSIPQKSNNLNINNNNNNLRTPAIPKNSNIMIQQNYEVKKSAQEIGWEMQQQQMIDQKSHKFQSQHWNQDFSKKKSSQTKFEDEIPEVIEFTQHQEIEMKEAEYQNIEQSLALPEDDIDRQKMNDFIESSSGQKNQTKLSDPEDQQTMQSEEFDNNEDFQRHLQLNMIKKVNNQLKEQHVQHKHIKIRPFSANMPLLGGLNKGQNGNNLIASNNIQHTNFNNNSNLTSYSTNHNNTQPHNPNFMNNHDKRSTGGFKKPKTIDVFGKITSPKNNIVHLEQSTQKNKGLSSVLHEDQSSIAQQPLFQYKGSNVSQEQSQFVSNFNNTNNPQHKLVSMTRMDDQTGIYNNLVNPSSVLYEEDSYQFGGGKLSSQPSFLRHDISYSSKVANNTNNKKPATQSVQSQQSKKTQLIMTRLDDMMSNLEQQIELEEKQNIEKEIPARTSYSKK